MDEIKNFSIRSWMPVLVFLRDGFEIPSSSLKCFFDGDWNCNIRFYHITIKDGYLDKLELGFREQETVTGGKSRLIGQGTKVNVPENR